MTTKAFAFGQFGTDVSLVGSGLVNTNIKTHNFLLFGGDAFSLGPVIHYNRFNGDVDELIIGAGMKMGSKIFTLVEGGLLKRKAFGVSGEGFAAILWLGYQLSRNVRFAFPLFYRKIDSGLNSRWRADILPYFGYQLRF